ncbi:PREDICTED: pectin acetylesterase 7-like [Ipomoea nil]|uniref:pectin acetylesterase 7-like n=1 Tax=Ipomoea nil TaxID=35883 RepID=UPI000901B620|nr:PREDICTED: pectin acetylesterase 7-like [Ipomoea nil]
MAIAQNCHQWLTLLVCAALLVLQTKANFYPLIFPEKAKAMGAVCLDGSPPAYHFVEGTVENKDNWLIYMEGGAWCESIEECKLRTLEHKGSSKHMMMNPFFPGDYDFGFYGILNRDPAYNPSEFVNWNLVVIRYCDGSSFTGDVEEPVDNLYFRGKRIFNVITDELLNKGLKNAKQVFLTGGSAGAVSVALHCDRFRKLLPNTRRFKCLMDGGYFIHVKKDNPKQVEGFELTFKNVVSLHNSTGMLPQTCTQKMKDKPYLCMFPQYLMDGMKTPMFILMSSYDKHQINISMHESFVAANRTIREHVQLATPIYEGLKGFRLQLLDALPNKPSVGIFINNCFFHTEIATGYWANPNSQVNNVLDSKAISDWYFYGKEVNLIDKSEFIKDCYTNGYYSS